MQPLGERRDPADSFPMLAFLRDGRASLKKFIFHGLRRHVLYMA
jgi:hypothetical protein